VRLLKSANAALYDNINPNSSRNADRLSKALGPARYAQGERARAAHRNGFEAFPLFAAAILAAQYAAWIAHGLLPGVGPALRAVYDLLYIPPTTLAESVWRAAIFVGSTALNASTLL
jgi:uncharacterized MAPEG superfamily protein